MPGTTSGGALFPQAKDEWRRGPTTGGTASSCSAIYCALLQSRGTGGGAGRTYHVPSEQRCRSGHLNKASKRCGSGTHSSHRAQLPHLVSAAALRRGRNEIKPLRLYYLMMATFSRVAFLNWAIDTSLLFPVLTFLRYNTSQGA